MGYSKEQLFVLAAVIITTGNVIGAFELPATWILAFAFIVLLRFRRRLIVIWKTLPRDATGIKRFIRLYTLMRKYQQNDWSLVDLFRMQLDKHPDKVCFYFEDQKWTFSDVEQYSNKIAHIFQQEGYKKGDVVALMMSNCIEYICIWFGLAKIGVVTALINTNLRNKSFLHCLTTAKVQGVIFSKEYKSVIQEVSEEMQQLKKYQLDGDANDADGTISLSPLLKKASKLAPILTAPISYKDKLYYIYTSGTTGLPKAAIIPHHRLIMVSLAGSCIVGIKPDDIVYCPLPLYHSSGGMLGAGGPLCCGSSTAFRKKFSASAYWTDCIKYNCTVGQYIGEICRYIQMVPPKPEDDQHKVRFIFGNGMRPSLWKDFVERFHLERVCEFYGSTEGNANIINIDKTIGAVGFMPRILPDSVAPVAIIKVSQAGEPIRDDEGFCIKCEPGEPGMLIGKILPSDATREYNGYVGDKKESEKKVIEHVFKKGDKAFLSGDILVMDELGYLYFKDRTGDTFRWKGENVSTTEVEAVISSVAGLRDVIVYGVQVGNTEGRAGMATIVDPDGELDLKALASALDKSLPSYARPPFLRAAQQADMTGTFKFKKFDLQKEGFNPELIKDKLYFRHGNSDYVELTKDIYSDVISGKIRM